MHGKIGIIVGIGLISIIIYKTYKLMLKLNIKNYKELLENIIPGNNKFIIETIKNIINIFLIISFFIMCSAFSTYCNETYGINRIIGGMLIAFLSYLILRNDIKAIIKTNQILIPIIIIFIIIMGGITIKEINLTNISINSNAITKGILYANYNSIILIPMLVTLKKQIKNKKQIKTIAIASFIVMLIVTMLIFKMQENIEQTKIEMPMLSIAEKISKEILIIYGIMTGIAIFTSAISTGYSLICNITEKEKTAKAIALILCVISIPISTISFSSLVNLIYPIFGILGTLQIIFLLRT